MLRRPLSALLVVLACLLAGATVWVAAVHTGWGGRLDSVVLSGFAGLRGERTEPVARFLIGLVDPLPFALLGAALACAALARGHARHAVVVAAVLAGANATSQLLKPLLAAPRPDAAPFGSGIAEAAWPSGHTTAAMSLALCLVLVAPVRLRPLAAALGGAFAVSVGYALLLVVSHYPSDVLGGFCVATGWLALGVAALRATDAREAAVAVRVQAVLAPAAATALAAAVALALLVLARPASAFSYAQEHTTFVGAAGVLGAAGLALAAGAAAALRRAR